MKIPTLFVAWTALVIMAVPLESKGQDTDFKPPGTEEIAAVDQAMLIARVGGAVGGSGMRADFANAQLKLINQRIEVLSEYLKQSSGN